MNELRILALDLSTSTGWATNATGGIESGVQKFELRRGESPGMRFLAFRQWLNGMLERLNPEVVVYEQAHHRGGSATELCIGFVTRVQECCADRKIDYRPVHSATLKLHATGSGRASKEEMISQANRIFPCVGIPIISDDNEADAICMLRWAMDGFPETARKPAKRKAKVVA